MNVKTLHEKPGRSDILSSADVAYNTIAEKILKGILSPGEKLSIRTMSKLTGVSMIPVIEALRRLEFEGLVESFPRWGSRVVALTPETVRDRNALREAIECQVVRILAETGLTKEQENRLQFLAAELDGTPRTDEPSSPFWDSHYRFHMQLAEYTSCQSLIRALHHVGLFFLLQRIILSRKKIFRKIPRDLHNKVIEAILLGDSQAADNAMRDHIRLSTINAPAISKP